MIIFICTWFFCYEKMCIMKISFMLIKENIVPITDIIKNSTCIELTCFWVSFIMISRNNNKIKKLSFIIGTILKQFNYWHLFLHDVSIISEHREWNTRWQKYLPLVAQKITPFLWKNCASLWGTREKSTWEPPEALRYHQQRLQKTLSKQ